MKKKLLTGLLTGLLLFMIVGIVNADTISAISRGAYDQTGVFSTGGSGDPDGNYLTGLYSGSEYRSFFAFDLGSVTGTIQTASFDISLADYGGGDPNETFTIFDFNSDINSLINNLGGIAAYNDLGTGIIYGQQGLSTSSSSAIVSMSLNSAGLLAINNAIGGNFAVGGAITSIVGTNDQFLFGSSIGNPYTTLNLNLTTAPVPEPTTIILFGIGLLGLAGLNRRKKQ